MHQRTPTKRESTKSIDRPGREFRVSCVSILLGFQCWIHLVFSLMGFVIFLVTIASWRNLGQADLFIEDYVANWKLKPYVEIVSTQASKCPEGFEFLINREFGTIAGWNWLGIKSQSDQIYPDNWDVNQAADGCQSILPMDVVKLSKLYSYNLCGRRSGNNFIDIERPTIVREGATCSKDK